MMNIWIETCCVTYNDTLLLGKYYIYSKKCQNSLPTHRGFIVRTKRVSNIELHIAKEKKQTTFSFTKLGEADKWFRYLLMLHLFVKMPSLYLAVFVLLLLSFS